MKKIILFAFASLFLVACGGGGGSSSSSSGFAPANADAFETKFVNQTLTSSSGVVSTILSGKRFSQTVSGVTIIVTYIYNNTGANIAASSYTIGSTTCMQTWTFTSALSGNGSEVCNSVSQGSFTFVFSGSN